MDYSAFQHQWWFRQAYTYTGTCTNGKQDGTETDIDCGGNDCGAQCFFGRKCLENSDCLSGSCGVAVGGLCDVVLYQWAVGSTFTFTSCGATGIYGPLLSQCKSAYTGSSTTGMLANWWLNP
jgi:hypothetical protein